MENEDEESNNNSFISQKRKKNNLKKGKKAKNNSKIKRKENKSNNNYNQIISISNIFNYTFKSKYHLNTKKLSLIKSNIKFPKSLTPLKSKHINNKNNSENIKEMYSDYNNYEKSYSYIKIFPENNQYIIYINENIYNIYNVKTGERIRSQKTNDINGFQGVLPLSQERILTFGYNFLRIYHYEL